MTPLFQKLNLGQRRELEPSMLTAFGSMGVRLEFDCYAPDDPKDAEGSA
jgi:hypothetical protein